MFDDSELQQIDWNSLGRPYEEQRVPELLRDLRDRAGKGRESYEEALSHLVNEINHQGTVYEVAAYAIPFLIDLVRAGIADNRADVVVDLLVWFGELGKDTLYKERHPPKDVPGVNPVTRQPIVYRAINDRPAAKKAREALRAGFDVYLGLLAGSDGVVRCAAAYAIAHYPELAGTFGPLIIAAAQKEKNPLLRAGIILSLGYLRDASISARELLEQTLQVGNSAGGRFAAAVSLAHIYGGQASDKAIELLRDARASSAYSNGLPGLPWPTYQDVEDAFELAGIKK